MLVVLNNKCNIILPEFDKYQDNLRNINSKNELVLCPSDIYLTRFNLKNFKLGSQNVSSYKIGAFTGEVSARQLESIGVVYSLVGHSERRNYQRENNIDISKKIDRLLSHNIIPILCIGETQEEKNSNLTKDVLIRQLKECLSNVVDKSKIVIAYEPIWAIGTGNTPTKEEIEIVIKNIKEILPNNKVIYGGSVNNINIDDLKTSKLIDGYLLGGLSLKIDELKNFINKLD